MPQPRSSDTVTVTVFQDKSDSNFGRHHGRYIVFNASDDTAVRGENIPMSVINVILRAVVDTRITATTAIQTLGTIAKYADEHGIVHPTLDGQQVTDPEYLSKTLGVTKAAVYRAYSLLDQLGYISWRKATRGAERVSGVSGQVRIIVSAS